MLRYPQAPHDTALPVQAAAPVSFQPGSCLQVCHENPGQGQPGSTTFFEPHRPKRDRMGRHSPVRPEPSHGILEHRQGHCPVAPWHHRKLKDPKVCLASGPGRGRNHLLTFSKSRRMQYSLRLAERQGKRSEKRIGAQPQSDGEEDDEHVASRSKGVIVVHRHAPQSIPNRRGYTGIKHICIRVEADTWLV
jgi:hypothetical protein